MNIKINRKKLTALIITGLMAVQFTAVVSAKDVAAVKAPVVVSIQQPVGQQLQQPEYVKAPKLALKLDRPDISQVPRNFRTGADQFKGKTKDGVLPSRKGMSTSNSSASSCFSEKEFEQVLKAVPTTPNKFYDIDLRGESHGYLNGNAVSWFGDHNWGNDGRTQAIVEHVEKDQLKNAKKKSPVEVYRFDDNKNTVMTPFQLDVNKVQTEQQMVESKGAHYFRLALSDHFRPGDKEVDQFISFYKTLPKDAWLHYHCFAGMGRTTIFMVMHDIMKNAKDVSFDDIIKRQALIGIVDLSSMGTKKNWELKGYWERYQFTRNFYDYVKAHPTFDMKWSVWAKDHGYDTYVPDYNGYIWRIDAKNVNQLPRNFRTSYSGYTNKVTDKLASFMDVTKTPTRDGLDTLNISGSAQASVGEFKAAVNEIKKYAKGPIYDIDLRQETHGYFDGTPVSWYGMNNWGNVDKTAAWIIPNEKKMLQNELNKKVLISELDKNNLAENPKYIDVTSAQTEADVAKANGVNYYRITCTDHVWPAPQYVDQFINFYKGLSKDAWLHFHCEAGVGRTTAYMAMVDMMRNPQVSLDDILYRQYLIGGNYVAYTIAHPSSKDWKADYYADKARMVKMFYTYVQQNRNNNYNLSWSQWLQKNDNV